MSDFQHVVLAGILQAPHRIVEAGNTDPEAFQDKVARKLFCLVVAYSERNGGNFMDLALARSSMERSKKKIASNLLDLIEDYDEYDPITDSEFVDGLKRLRREHERTLLKERGRAVVEAVVEGDWEEARAQFRLGALAAQDASDPGRPTNIWSPSEVRRSKLDLEKRINEEAEGSQAFDVGFEFLTDRVSFRRKELTILGGYSADGKTSLVKTLIYNAQVNSQAKVFFAALEMSKEEMKVLFAAQHAAKLSHPGIDYRSILDGCPSPRDHKLYYKALDDLSVEDHEDSSVITSKYGSLVVWAPETRPTMSEFANRLRAAKQEHGINVGVADHLGLILPDDARKPYRLILKDHADESKALSRELDIWLVLTHQISRAGRDKAEKRDVPHYVMSDLGESSGIEQAMDQFVWIYTTEEYKDQCEAKVGIGKARKGKTLVRGRFIMADYARANMAEIRDDDE